jgi:ABC-2 type transport system ATP-binding protein
VITELVASGTTLLLTTQYLEEADRLADRIAVVDNGKVIGLETADALKNRVGGDQIELTVHDASELEAARLTLTSLTGGDVRTDPGSLQLTAPVTSGAASLTEALVRLASEGVTLRDVALRRPTLDDVFLTLTGHEAGAATAAGTDKDKELAR